MNLVHRIQSLSTFRNIGITLVLMIVSFSVMTLLLVTRILPLSGGLLILDLRFGYTYDEVSLLLAALGSEGLQVYTIMYILDFFFRTFYLLLMVFVWGYITNKTFLEGSHLNKLLFFPVFEGIFDYLENTLILTQISSFPQLSLSVISAASLITIVKVILLIANMSAVLILYLWMLMKRKS